MGEVIHVNFDKAKVLDDEQHGVPGTSIDVGLNAYLDSLREKGVDEDDILDTFDAILDKDMYFASDDVIQKFADGWLHQFL